MSGLYDALLRPDSGEGLFAQHNGIPYYEYFLHNKLLGQQYEDF